MNVGVDCVVFGLDGDKLEVLLVRRDEEPFRGEWALPGGLVRPDESLEDAARRVLRDEASVDKVYLEQLYTFGDPGRDPRGRVITVAYYALVKIPEHAGSWFSCWELPKLAFDHARIVQVALARLKGKVRWQPIGFELLAPKFTLRQLQRVYEAILERELDKRNFRKKILSMDVLVETDEVERDVAHRAARLYRFDKRRYDQLEKQGFNFEL